MPSEQEKPVTMRIRVGDSEIEVTGPPDFVDRRIKDFLKNPPKPQQGAQASSVGKHTARQAPADSEKRMSPAQFFRKMGARTDRDKTLAAAYYLEHSRDQENFTAAEVKGLIQEARNNPPKNVSDCINGNIQKGLIMGAGERDNRKAFVLTSDGDDYVQDKFAE